MGGQNIMRRKGGKEGVLGSGWLGDDYFFLPHFVFLD